MQPFEMTASFLMMADHPGIPLPIKLEEQHKPFVNLDVPMSEAAGAQLAEWALGGAAVRVPDAPMTVRTLNGLVRESGIGVDMLRSCALTLYPGRSATELSADELASLWAAVVEADRERSFT
jgi:hypothetical protein